MTDILGHTKVFDVLRKSATDRHTAQSYLFSGTEGIGKRLVAIEFACMLNCPSYSITDHLHCNICERIRKGNHPDVRIEIPIKGSVKIDRVRYLQSFLKYSPVEAPFRVIIIDDAHLINRAAQNALLKTLEEPPAYSLLILVTSRVSSLLPTVRSRLRKIMFSPLPRSVIAQELVRIKNLSLEEAQTTAGLSSGSLGRAIELHSNNSIDLRRSVMDFFNSGSKFGVSGLLELSAQVSVDQRKILDAIEMGMTWINDLMKLKLGAEESSVINTDLIDILRYSAQHHSIDELLAIRDIMSDSMTLVDSDTNINRNLISDVMFLKIRQEMTAKSQ
ncbi:MAG: DNA polymerase III subunit delta' [Pseudomonadota bacterium]